MDREKYLENLKNEILNDPANMGYGNKSSSQIADLINTPIQIKTDIIKEADPIEPVVGDKIGEKVEVKDPRVFSVILGVVGAPNGVSAQDIEEALQVKSKGV